ncbi:lipid A 1-phosphatase LpxE [Rhizobium tubonense]|uniref:Phosphatase n=1 Tax=Rhizobium tubonense TaxID=484088 RepID=A0A2W4ECF6_9HYPH|nr:lipid A 1-phosphatase LpxE [Rhizobium tubonense]PZM09753.1 phosphatase [Rhizobium tubonense]
MRAILTSLDKRWRRSETGFAPLRWQTCLFITANIVLLSALLLDSPVGAGMRHISPPVHFFGRMLTDFGDSGWIIVVSAFLFIEGWAGSRLLKSARCRCQAVIVSRIGGYFLVSIALSGLIANLLKRIIGRARPVHFDDWGILGFSPFSSHAAFQSFPSGHATTIGAFFAALMFLFPRYRIIFAVCAIWLAATRVMIGAHYPSDVVAGLALGAWFSFMIAIVYSRYGLLFRTDESGWPAPRLPILRK